MKEKKSFSRLGRKNTILYFIFIGGGGGFGKIKLKIRYNLSLPLHRKKVYIFQAMTGCSAHFPGKGNIYICVSCKKDYVCDIQFIIILFVLKVKRPCGSREQH